MPWSPRQILQKQNTEFQEETESSHRGQQENKRRQTEAHRPNPPLLQTQTKEEQQANTQTHSFHKKEKLNSWTTLKETTSAYTLVRGRWRTWVRSFWVSSEKNQREMWVALWVALALVRLQKHAEYVASVQRMMSHLRRRTARRVIVLWEWCQSNMKTNNTKEIRKRKKKKKKTKKQKVMHAAVATEYKQCHWVYG